MEDAKRYVYRYSPMVILLDLGKKDQETYANGKGRSLPHISPPGLRIHDNTLFVNDLCKSF